MRSPGRTSSASASYCEGMSPGSPITSRVVTTTRVPPSIAIAPPGNSPTRIFGPQRSAGAGAFRAPSFPGLRLDLVFDHGHLDLGILVEVVLHLLVVHGRLGLHVEVLDPAHLGPARHFLVVPLDIHEFEGTGLDA